MRSAVQRRVFNLAPPKQTLVNETFAEFLAQVDALNQSGAFTPPAPPEAPVPIRGPLSNTLLVSAAAIRDLSSVPAPLAGLPLATITDSQGQSRSINLRGRIDVGFVIERDGDYGLAFIARGPLLANPADLESADTIGGDIRIDVSNAVDLAALEGLRVEEGLTIGAALESTLVTANSAGLETWGVTVGYGSGFQFGTSVSFTRVVKLGNINALLPQFPKM
jgi:hypothetical protein